MQIKNRERRRKIRGQVNGNWQLLVDVNFVVMRKKQVSDLVNPEEWTLSPLQLNININVIIKRKKTGKLK